MDITLYTLEHCPKCKILKKKLEDKKITFKEVKDEAALESLGIFEVPVLVANGEKMTMVAANKWINNLEVNNG